MLNSKSKRIIDNYIFTIHKRLDSLSLFSGLSSQILAKIEFGKHFQNDNIKSAINADINHLFYLIENLNTLNATFSNGLSGAGWLILILNEEGLIDINPDLLLEEIDDFVIEQLKMYLKYQNFDILHGSIGIGIYLLKRGKTECVIDIINSLYINAIKSDDEIKWKNIFPRKQNQNTYDLSLAHGHTGILYFLGKCYKQKISADLCKVMIDGIFKFYFNNIQNQTIAGAFWPSKIDESSYKSGSKLNELSRLAWCYGDLGTLQVMNLVAIWTKDICIEERTEKLLEETAKRVNIKDNLIDNTYMCHGISGIISVYSSIYRRRKNPIFKDAAEFWYNELIKLYNLYDDSFHRLQPADVNSLAEKGILHGREGILLSILSLYKSNTSPKWHEVFFMA
ncbi:lanthionine synthetase LanC family protein [Pedobacter jeongneungensis]|uniref:lanthionine synthetase LanC family protein n=1 Tax=Pedobacter jeongneungensis TaxID=947309 RepID=UPI000468C9A2|nr:lanthionine synthetase LanC family protein [Pedobacter jeongneungensis]